ncbi:uncharacterized protein LOC129749233 [Uranotaenia lowii]|uniref:uncharacterized protein LOC129749233 n=1 Tax=Uranotaenia lowii TaxID=190385 RepID=UPI0024797148|nr:uncharacterized protein LOC129749233 [Uranotaenia lowii]
MRKSKVSQMSSGRALILLLVSLCCSVVECQLPSTIKVCSRNDTKLDACIIDAVERIRPNLASGDFGADFAVPRIEPLYLEKMQMSRGKDFQAVFHKLNVSGPSTFKLEKIKSNPMNLSFDISLSIPKLNFSGKYSINMKVLLLEVKGKGKIRGTLSKMRMNIRLRGFTENINGTDYVRFRRMGMKIKIDDGSFVLDNLFDGDPVLGKVGNQVINDNPRLFLDEIIPGLEKNLSKTFTDIANQLLYNATIDDLFPEVVDEGSGAGEGDGDGVFV